MPRYLIEHTFSDGLQIPQNEEGARIYQTVVTNNTDDGMIWVHSYFT